MKGQKFEWKFLSFIPPLNGRYYIVDTETTGVSNNDHIIEIAAVEICNGKLTGAQFQGFIKPRTKINYMAEKTHKMNNQFYDNFFKDCYQSDKTVMENFLKFVGNTSLIFAHNAIFDSRFINSELMYWKLPQIKRERFRCSVRIFRSIYSSVCQKASLSNCAQFFNLKSMKENFHSALFDSFITARVVCKIFEEYYNKNTKQKLEIIGKEDENCMDIDNLIENLINDHPEMFQNKKSIIIDEETEPETMENDDINAFPLYEEDSQFKGNNRQNELIYRKKSKSKVNRNFKSKYYFKYYK
jgi:DNA polymerase III epsilon subunit family exonuclease